MPHEDILLLPLFSLVAGGTAHASLLGPWTEKSLRGASAAAVVP